MATKSISQLDTAESLALGDLFEIAIPDGNSATGYSSRKTSLTNIADFTQSTAANNSLETTAKTIVGAINEVDAEGVKWEQENILGAKNLCPYITTDLSGTEINGATFEVLEDGKIKVNRTVTTGDAVFVVSDRTRNSVMFLPNGTYRVSGSPNGGNDNTFYIAVSNRGKNGSNVSLVREYGDGATFTISDGDYYSDYGSFVRVTCVLRSGQSANDMIFSPFITQESVKDLSYTSPTQSNREITVNKLECKNVSDSENANVASKAYSVGDYIIIRGLLYKVTAPISASGAITIGTNVTQTTIGAELKALFDALSQ